MTCTPDRTGPISIKREQCYWTQYFIPRGGAISEVDRVSDSDDPLLPLRRTPSPKKQLRRIPIHLHCLNFTALRDRANRNLSDGVVSNRILSK